MSLAENLKRTFKKYVLLKGDTYNTIVDALREKPLTQPGYSFADRQSATYSHSNRRSGYFLFTCSQNLLQRSIFGISEFPEYNDPCIVTAQNINYTTNASPFGLFTNIKPYNISDGYGLCKPIDFYQPTLLSVSDIANFPQFGMPCGPDINTGGWGISGKSFGLLCISNPNPDTGSDSLNNVWCVRTPDPCSVIGTIYQNDVQAFNNNTLGSGLIQLQYRTPQGVLVNAVGPTGLPLILPVYNASASSTFKANTLVKCICVLGVGLVIIDSSSLVWGRADDANIPHFTSGQIKVYSGVPGSEFLDSLSTPYTAFNHGPEIVKDEWCFLTPSGDKNCPYYVIQNEYNGMVLGKPNNHIVAPDDVSGDQVNIWGGDPGGEVSFSTNVTARLKNLFGAIPKNSWLIATFLGPDATANHGGWYITSAQRGSNYAGRIKPGQADQSTQWCNVGTKVKVELFIGDPLGVVPGTGGLVVSAYIQYAPLLENEYVHIEWNGDMYIITKAELDGGFEATVTYDISKGGVGYVDVNISPLSTVVVNGLQVTSNLGLVKTGKKVNIFRNRSGFRVVSGEC